VVVATRLVGTGGDTTKLDYQLRETAGGWRVVDILLDGAISRVAVTRSDFRSLLAQGTTAGDASALIASLRQKSTSLAAGGTS
jgi:phospholipid transport system substrate-binding protein